MKKLITNLMVLVVLAFSSSTVNGQSLIAQWNLDEGSGTSVSDVTGNLPAGTLTGGVWVADMDGNASQAINFAATDDKAVLSTDNSVTLQESYTIALWVKANTATDGNTWSKILGFGSTAAKVNNSEIGMNNGTFFISIYGQDGDGTPGQGYYNAGTIAVGEWMHVAHTYDAASGMASIYVNGILEDSRASVGLYTTYTDPTVFAIGQAATGPGADRNIDVDDIYFYDGALSGAEIKSLSVDIPQLIANWNLDEGSGMSVNDVTGNLPAGTLTGGAWVADMDGNTGKAINISDDGTGNYDKIVLSEDASVVLQANYTVSFWVKQNAAPNDWANVFGFGTTAGKNDANSNNVGMGFLNDGRFYIEHQCNASSGPDFRNSAYSKAKIVVNEWTHIAYSFDAVDSVLNVYYNGVLDVSKTSFVGLTPGDVTNPSIMVVGTGVNGWTDARDMVLDDIHFYDGALGDAEIKNLSSNIPQLVAHWNMNEGSGTEVNDVTGNLPAGTLTGGAWVADMDGNASQAINFAATDDKAVLSTDNSVTLQGSYTVALWVKANTATDGNTWSKILGFGSTAAKVNNSEIGMNNGTFFISIYGQDGDGTPGQGYYNAGTIAVGEWMHVAHTYDAASGMASIYVNGILEDSRASVGLYTNYTDPTVFAIGQAATGPGADRDIDVDDIYFYDGVLGEDKIATLAVAAPLIAHWDMNEGSGTAVNDVSGNLPAGVLTGGSWVTDMDGYAAQAININDDGAGNFDKVVLSTDPGAVLQSNFTVAFWVKQNAAPNDWANVFGFGTTAGKNDANSNNVGMGFLNDGRFYIEHQCNASSGPDFRNTAYSKAKIVVNEWTHIAYSFDAVDSVLNVYYNGVLDVSKTSFVGLTPGDVTNPSIMVVGTGVNGWTDVRNMDMDDIYFYGKALSESEIQILSGITFYELTANASTGGTVSGGGFYAESSEVTVTATPDEGYLFDSWSGDLSGTTNPESITMDADKSVTATFIEDKVYPLAHWRMDEGSGTEVNDATGNHPAGIMFGGTWAANRNGNADSAININDDGAGTFDKIVLSEDTNLVLQANYTVSFWVKQNAAPNDWANVFGFGTTAGKSDANSNNVGMGFLNDGRFYVEHQCNASSGPDFRNSAYSSAHIVVNEWTHIAYSFDAVDSVLNVYYNGVLDVSKTSFVGLTPGDVTNPSIMVVGTGTGGWTDARDMVLDDVYFYDEALSLEAINELMTNPPASFTLITTAETGGTVSEGRVYDENAEVTITATPGEGYLFLGWTGDLSGKNNPETIIMDADKSVTATFKLPAEPVLMVHYPMDQTTDTSAIDASGNGYDMPFTNIDDSNWKQSLITGPSLNLNGVDESGYFDPGTDVFHFTEFTMAASFRMASTGSTDWVGIMNIGDGCYVTVREEDNGTLQFIFNSVAGGGQPLDDYKFHNHLGNLFDGDFHHVAITHSDDFGSILYFDGVDVYHRNFPGDSGTVDFKNNMISIGASGFDAPHNFLPGDIQDVRYYEGVLSAEEVQSLIRPTVKTSVAYYAFDETSGTTAVDDINALDLTLGNTADSNWGAGVEGGSLSLNGVDQDGTSTSVDLELQTMSIFAYVKCDPDKADIQTIASEGENYGFNVQADGNLGFYIHNDQGSVSTVTAGENVKDGYWHHVAVTFDAASMDVNFYMEGVLVGTETLAGGEIDWASASDFTVGSQAGTNFLQGSIDELNVYAIVMDAATLGEMIAERRTLTTALSVSGTGSGTISPASGLFYDSDVVIITATPDANSVFISWDGFSGTVASANNPVSVTVTSDVIAAAIFDSNVGIENLSNKAGVRAYPNPFSSQTTIKYELNNNSHVQLAVFDMLGKQVSILTNEFHHAGAYAMTWYGTDASGNSLSNGIYTLRVKVGTEITNHKLIINR